MRRGNKQIPSGGSNFPGRGHILEKQRCSSDGRAGSGCHIGKGSPAPFGSGEADEWIAESQLAE